MRGVMNAGSCKQHSNNPCITEGDRLGQVDVEKDHT